MLSRAWFFVVVITITTAAYSPLSQRYRKYHLYPWDRTDVVLGTCLEEQDDQLYEVTINTLVGLVEQVVIKLPPIHSDEDDTDDTTRNSLSTSLWPGGIAAAMLVQSSPALRSHLLQNARVLELGAGLGLLSDVLSSCTPHLTVTDHDDAAVSRLKEWFLSSSSCSVGKLEWRDVHNDNHRKQAYDLVIGSDVAYYWHLLRPLMDTIRYFGKSQTSVLLFGQCNRQSHWDLYDNIVNGCYNPLTDEHEDSWDGETRMLLYRLERLEDEDSCAESIPIAVLQHEGKCHPLTDWDYVATPEDRSRMDISF